MPKKNRLILIFFIFFVLSIIFTFPSILHLGDKLIGDGGDNYQYFSFQYIAGQKIKNFAYPFSQTDIFRYPAGFNFGIGYDSVLNALIGAIIGLFVSNIIAYNLTVLLLLSLNGLLSYILFRYISKNTLLGFFGALIYGFSSYVMARTAGHINLMFVGALPFMVYSILKIYESEITHKDIFRFYMSFFLVFAGSFQYALLTIIGISLFVLTSFAFYKKELIGLYQKIIKKWRSFLLIGIPFFIIMFIIAYPFLKASMTGSISSLDRSSSVSEFSPSLVDFIVPNHFSRLLIGNFMNSLTSSQKSIEKAVFIGFAEIVLFIGLLFSHYQKKLKIFLITLITIFFVLSLGNSVKIFGMNVGLPFILLYNKFPFSYIPEAGRFFIFFYLIFTVLVIYFLNNLLSKKNLLIYIFLAFAFILIIFERLPYQFWLSPMFENKQYIKFVKQGKGAAAFDIPAQNHFDTTTYNILPYVYNKKIISGYFHYLADTKNTKYFLDNPIINRFVCNGGSYISALQPAEYQQLNNALVEMLKSNDIYTIVVHKNDPEDHAKYYFPDCANVRVQASTLLPQLFFPDQTGQQKIMSLFFPAILGIGDTINFPKNGIFYIDGIQAYPSDWLPLHISVDDKEITMNKDWAIRGGKNVTLDPFLKISVNKGSKISFSFEKNNNTGYSFIKLWYRYEPTTKQINDLSINGIKKIYEDDDAAVFSIL